MLKTQESAKFDDPLISVEFRESRSFFKGSVEEISVFSTPFLWTCRCESVGRILRYICRAVPDLCVEVGVVGASTWPGSAFWRCLLSTSMLNKFEKNSEFWKYLISIWYILILNLMLGLSFSFEIWTFGSTLASEASVIHLDSWKIQSPTRDT